MKILLVSTNVCVEPYPVYPLGMSVAANALALNGFDVEQFDVLANGLLAGLEKRLRENSYGLIGISLRNIDMVNSRADDAAILDTPFEAVRLIRKYSQAPLLLGGSGFTLLPDALMERTGADFGIVGEGEEAIVRLARAVAEGTEKTLPKILSGKFPDQAPALYDDGILDYYYQRTHIVPIQTKRGCPYHCVYCTYPKLEGAAMRARDVRSVARQIAKYREKYPDALFFFVDAVFNDPDFSYRPLLAELKKTCGPVPFDCFLSPGGLPESELDDLCSAGMISASVGIDATTDETLRGLGKNFTFDEARKCVRHLLKREVGLYASVMFGGPGETYDTIRRGIENIQSLAPAFTEIFSGIRILPDTALYEIAKKQGKIPAGWNGIDSLFYFENGLDPERVNAMLTEGFRNSPFGIYPPDKLNRCLRTIHKIGYVNFRNSTQGGNGLMKGSL